MSYINSALRKVQQERDSRYAAYGDFIASCPDGGRNGRHGRRKGASADVSWRTFALPAAVAVTLAILAVVAWLFFRPTIFRATTAKVNVPAAGPSPQLSAALPSSGTLPARGPASPAAAVREDSARVVRSAQIYETALAAQRGKRWQEAEALYQQALALDPRHVQALNNLGVLYMTQKRSAEAIELFVKAMAIQVAYVDPYYNLACLYAQLGNVRTSLNYLERAAKIDGQVRKWAKQDNDFKKMQSLPEFNNITEELVK